MLAKAHSSMQAFLPSHLKKKKKSAVSIIKHFKALLKHAVGKPSKCLNFNRLLKGPLKSAEEVCGASTAEPLKARPRDTRWALGEENHSKNWSGGWEKSTKKRKWLNAPGICSGSPPFHHRWATRRLWINPRQGQAISEILMQDSFRGGIPWEHLLAASKNKRELGKPFSDVRFLLKLENLATS